MGDQLGDRRRARQRHCAGLTLVLVTMLGACASAGERRVELQIVGEAELFAPDIASTEYSEVRLTFSPDGQTALWFSSNRLGGPGGYDIWMSRRTDGVWSAASPVAFNSPGRDFDPAFSADGRYVYFCSDRPGGLGGDDIYRVAVSAVGFGAVEPLGPEVNSAGDEYAPMLSPDQTRLLFASDGRGGAGRHDLFVALRRGDRFEPAEGLVGGINTPGDDFDATFLTDSSTIVFSRAPNLRTDRIDLLVASRLRDGRYEAGILLPLSVNTSDHDTFGPMIDWSRPDHFAFNGQRPGEGSMDLHVVRYRLAR